MQLSYCTTCKNRLWQLKQTLPSNIMQTSKDVDIVLLDYNSDDGLQDYIVNNFADYLANGQLKYYQLESKRVGFDMAYAKNVVHKLATGKVLFNLDADNFIGTTVTELLTLPTNTILLPKMVANTGTGRCGRIGLHKSDFNRLCGYDENIVGMADDDGNLVRRAIAAGFDLFMSEDTSIPIPQTHKQKFKHVVPQLPQPNPTIVKDINGRLIELGT